MVTLYKYQEHETPTLRVPITKQDALDMADEMSRANNTEAEGFWYLMACDAD
jgi:hypothetical protein